MLDRILSFGPSELIGALFSSPLTSLALAALGTFVVLAFRSGRSGVDASPGTPEEYRPEHRMLRLAGVGVIVLFTAEHVLRSYMIMSPLTISWWRVAVAPALAALGIALVFTVLATRRYPASSGPVPPLARRTWMTFTSGPLALATVGAAVALLLTTLVAGSLSSANPAGQHVWLEIPITNEPEVDPVRVLFFGWTYGVAALISMAVLVATIVLLLRRSAAQPYAHPDTAEAEKQARRRTATASLRVTLAAILLALAGAWRMIATAGTVATLDVSGDGGTAHYDATWRYAEFAAVAGWAAPLLEITAFCLLILVARMTTRTARAAVPASDPAVWTESGAQR